ncbi:MAG: carboxyvinyl-carboxyphosphonate phosphorylmutase [Deltaproteobacteria bacterium]|nr:carboxyvinyl-carboxyphosphonate phosphorylmutase [Deltaproteobacteria bacterium]
MGRSAPPGPRSRADEVRALVRRGKPIVMGGLHDGVSARLAEKAGFPLAFMGGYAVAASLLGEPDIGLLTQAEMADTARRLCRLVSMPVLVDADTGYGGIPNAVRTAELYAQAGAAGLFLEDQVWPKRCGHMGGKSVVDRRDWLAKLRAVVELRPHTDLFVVARTDARAPLGLEEAIRRGRAALDVGVDAVFVEAPQSVAELDAIAMGVPGPKVANMVEWGRTPLLGPKELHQRGFDLIVFPVAAILAQARAVEDVYATLVKKGSTADSLERLYEFESFNQLLGLDAHRARERESLEGLPTPGLRVAGGRSGPRAPAAKRSQRVRKT